MPRKGYKQTDEHKKRLSKSMIGKQNCLGNQNHLGHKHSDDTKKRLSEMNKGKYSGANHPNWRGGVSFEPYCPKFNNSFKEMVRDKFGRVCFICGKTEEDNGSKLSVHHVNYDKSCLCGEIECEFVPLCRSCHNKTSNGNRKYYERMLLEKLSK